MYGRLPALAKYMNEVLVDTNVMVYCFDRKIDINTIIDQFFQSGFKILTLKKCIYELSKIGRDDVKSFFLSYKIEIIDSDNDKTTDDVILDTCSKNNFYLFTEDNILIERAKSLGIKTLSLSGNSIKFNK